MPNQRFTNIFKNSRTNWKYILIVFILATILGGGILGYQYWWMPKEEVKISERMPKTGITQWREYVLEEITEDFQSPNFMDRRLIGIKDGGQRDVIVPSVKELMGWEKTPGETGFYPVKVSFPPYSSKIFFVKYIAGTGHSAGFFMLDVNTLEFKELTEVSQIYENYYNYLSIVSPDGLKIASYGNNDLYLLDLQQDKAILLARTQTGEAFYLASETPEFQWIDNYTVQYPVHSAQDIYAPSIEIRQISIETKEVEKVVKDETTDWKTYKSEKLGFSIKYPKAWPEPKETILATRTQVEFTPIRFIWVGVAYDQEKQRELTYLEVAKRDTAWSNKEPQLITVDGQPAAYLEIRDEDLPYPKIDPFNFVTIQKGRNIFAIYYSLSTVLSEQEAEQKIFNQMLSTFEFLE